MRKEIKNIVWLKRDLRTRDHEPFFKAENQAEDYLCIYIFEPDLLAYQDSDLRHHQFVYQSILDINKTLQPFNRQVVVFYASAIEVFQYLCRLYHINNVFSYQESGVQITWDRDKQVARYFKKNGINWIEAQRDGIIRGIKNRVDWDKKWFYYANASMINNRYSFTKERCLRHPFNLPDELLNQLSNYPSQYQKAGEKFAFKYLNSFCEERGKNYVKHISKPQLSRKACGRISPHLAWGNLSSRQVYQYVRAHPNYFLYKRAFKGMLTRLKWRCHFIQKFEVECRYESECINRGYELLQFKNNPKLIEAWENGQTGIPLVDACMRCLKQTGWINFRMRAMLVSVFCHNFDCNWKNGAYFLARQFLDYEPGIHFPQFQMQAGTTGVNTIRMYNPIKQAQDQDPEACFIKQWIPELKDVPVPFIHDLSKMTHLDRQFLKQSFDYPDSIVDIEETARLAREKIWGHRKNTLVQKERARILKVHTRNSFKRRE